MYSIATADRVFLWTTTIATIFELTTCLIRFATCATIWTDNVTQSGSRNERSRVHCRLYSFFLLRLLDASVFAIVTRVLVRTTVKSVVATYGFRQWTASVPVARAAELTASFVAGTCRLIVLAHFAVSSDFPATLLQTERVHNLVRWVTTRCSEGTAYKDKESLHEIHCSISIDQ